MRKVPWRTKHDDRDSDFGGGLLVTSAAMEGMEPTARIRPGLRNAVALGCPSVAEAAPGHAPARTAQETAVCRPSVSRGRRGGIVGWGRPAREARARRPVSKRCLSGNA